MIEQPARVTAVDGGYAWVDPRPSSGCGSCQAGPGCGVVLFSGLLSQRRACVWALNTAQAAAGEQVIIGIDERAFLRAALAVYGLPLVGMLAGALGGAFLARYTPHVEGVCIGGAILGLAAVFWGLHRYAGRLTAGTRPAVIGRIAATGSLQRLTGP